MPLCLVMAVTIEAITQITDQHDKAVHIPPSLRIQAHRQEGYVGGGQGF